MQNALLLSQSYALCNKICVYFEHTSVGTEVGLIVGTDDGSIVGTDDGLFVGTEVGLIVGTDVGSIVGTDVGPVFLHTCMQPTL